MLAVVDYEDQKRKIPPRELRLAWDAQNGIPIADKKSDDLPAGFMGKTRLARNVFDAYRMAKDSAGEMDKLPKETQNIYVLIMKFLRQRQQEEAEHGRQFTENNNSGDRSG